MRAVFFAVSFVALISAAAAQDLAASREASMKEVGRAFGELNRMNRGQAPYDGAAAQAAFSKIAENVATFGTLFPEGSQPDKRSLPAIWENKADFDARVKKLAADATESAGSAGADEAAFKSAFAVIQPQCGECHQAYRGRD